MSGWGVIPSIRVTDLEESLDFYVGRLGFTVDGDPADRSNLSIVRGDARLMLETSADFYSDTYNAAIRDRLGGGSPNALYMEAEDLEELYDALRQAGARIVDPLVGRAWGQDEFTVEDPAGNWLTFWKKTSGGDEPRHPPDPASGVGSASL